MVHDVHSLPSGSCIFHVSFMNYYYRQTVQFVQLNITLVLPHFHLGSGISIHLIL